MKSPIRGLFCDRIFRADPDWLAVLAQLATIANKVPVQVERQSENRIAPELLRRSERAFLQSVGAFIVIAVTSWGSVRLARGCHGLLGRAAHRWPEAHYTFTLDTSRPRVNQRYA